MNPTVLLGPPGTGKTTKILDIIDSLLSSGYAAEEIGVFTFTRAAKWEVLQRMRRDDEETLWVRTIHSACHRLLGTPKERLMKAYHWRKFAEQFGFVFSFGIKNNDNDQPDLTNPQTDDDMALSCLEYIHAQGYEPATFPRVRSGELPCWPRTGWHRIIELDTALKEYKRQHKLVAYHDTLVAVYHRGLCPPVRVLLVDEAQDLSPMQASIIDMWSRHVERVYLAGDDDQAVYQWSGASPAWLIQHARRAGAAILNKSYRLPVEILKFALRISQRIRDRVAKTYDAHHDGGTVSFVSSSERDKALEMLGNGNGRLLLRSTWQLHLWSKWLDRARIPWGTDGRFSASWWQDDTLQTAIATIRLLRQGQRPDTQMLSKLYQYIPSGNPLAPRGIKTALERGVQIDIAPLVQAAMHDPFALLENLPEERKAILRATIGDTWKLPPLRLIVTTIHGAKGREGDTIIVDHPLPRAMCRSSFIPDAEHRVAYVAATRARQRLIYVTGRGYYPY